MIARSTRCIVNLITFTITGLSMGVTVVRGQYLGEKREEPGDETVGEAVMRERQIIM